MLQIFGREDNQRIREDVRALPCGLTRNELLPDILSMPGCFLSCLHSRVTYQRRFHVRDIRYA